MGVAARVTRLSRRLVAATHRDLEEAAAAGAVAPVDTGVSAVPQEENTVPVDDPDRAVAPWVTQPMHLRVAVPHGGAAGVAGIAASADAGSAGGVGDGQRALDSGPGGGHRGIDVGGVAAGDAGQHAAVAGVEQGQGLATVAVTPGAGDQHLAGVEAGAGHRSLLGVSGIIERMISTSMRQRAVPFGQFA